MEVREREKDCVCEVESGWGNSKQNEEEENPKNLKSFISTRD